MNKAEETLKLLEALPSYVVPKGTNTIADLCLYKNVHGEWVVIYDDNNFESLFKAENESLLVALKEAEKYVKENTERECEMRKKKSMQIIRELRKENEIMRDALSGGNLVEKERDFRREQIVRQSISNQLCGEDFRQRSHGLINWYPQAGYSHKYHGEG